MNFKRPEGLSIQRFVAIFSSKANKVRSTGTVLSDGILGYILLKAANLSNFQNDLVKATCHKFTYQDIKTQLIKILSTSTSSSINHISTDDNIQRSNGEYNFSFVQQNHCDHHGRRKDIMKQSNSNHCQSISISCNASLFLNNRYHNAAKLSSITVATDLCVKTLDKAVIDTCCLNTVAGNIWFESYISSLSKNDKCSIQLQKSQNKYKCNDGTVRISKRSATIPIYIGTSRFKLSVDIIDYNIPLILGRATLQRANAEIKNGSKTMLFCGSIIPLIMSSSGCMYVQVGRLLDATNMETKKALARILSPPVFCPLTSNAKHKAQKLHLQFCHASANHLTELLKCAGTFDESIFRCLQQVTEHCELCLKIKKPLNKNSSFIRTPSIVVDSNVGHESSGESESDDDDEIDDDNSDSDKIDDDVDDESYDDAEWTCVNDKRSLPKVGSLIECKFENYDPIVKCRVLSKAGKSSTANWHFLNIIEQGEDQGKCCSFKNAFWRSVDNANGKVNED